MQLLSVYLHSTLITGQTIKISTGPEQPLLSQQWWVDCVLPADGAASFVTDRTMRSRLVWFWILVNVFGFAEHWIGSPAGALRESVWDRTWAVTEVPKLVIPNTAKIANTVLICIDFPPLLQLKTDRFSLYVLHISEADFLPSTQFLTWYLNWWPVHQEHQTFSMQSVPSLYYYPQGYFWLLRSNTKCKTSTNCLLSCPLRYG